MRAVSLGKVSPCRVSQFILTKALISSTSFFLINVQLRQYSRFHIKLTVKVHFSFHLFSWHSRHPRRSHFVSNAVVFCPFHSTDVCRKACVQDTSMHSTKNLFADKFIINVFWLGPSNRFSHCWPNRSCDHTTFYCQTNMLPSFKQDLQAFTSLHSHYFL